MEDIISIIVPVYNVEKYLKRCINSLLEQTYCNIEILLIDDGSTDRSLDICRKYEQKDSRIYVFHKNNEGLGMTRNYGIRKSRGKYITFVDSDDYLVPNAIELMLKKAQQTGADVVIANSYYKNHPQKVLLSEGLYTGDDIKKILLVHMMGNSAKRFDGLTYTAWGKLYKRKLFTEDNLQFPSERKLIWEDLAFSVSLYPICKKVYLLHQPVYYYCFNEGSLTHTYKPNKLELVMVLYKYMNEKLNELQLPENAFRRLDNSFIGHIRTCIKLEVFYARQNGFQTAIKNITDICNRTDVQQLIRNFPKKDYNKLQLIYNFFMENHIILGVFFLTWLQNKKKRIE